MKKTLLFSLFTTFFIYSCTKDEIIKENTPQTPYIKDTPLSVDEAKKWFQNDVFLDYHGRVVNQNGKISYLHFDWEKASKKTLENKTESIVVPIFNISESNFDENSFTKVSKNAYKNRKIPNVVKSLLVYKDSKGKKSLSGI